MRTKNNYIEDFIRYLDYKLSTLNLFFKCGPRTYYYKDGLDTIFVYVKDDNLIIINDGDNVIDGIEMIKLNFIESDEAIFDSYLQKILHKF